MTNLQQRRNNHGGQSTGAATDIKGLATVTKDIIGLPDNPLYNTGVTQQAEEGDSTCAERLCTCGETFSRTRLFRAFIIIIALASCLCAAAATIMYITGTYGKDHLDTSLDEKTTTASSEETSTDTTATDHLKVTATPDTSSSAAQTTTHDDLTTTVLSEVIKTSPQFPHTSNGVLLERTEKQVLVSATIKGVLVDTLGQIVVANEGTGRVDMFTSEGEFVRTVVNTRFPAGIALGPHGHLVVTNRIDNTVTIFPPQGTDSQKA
uniref:Uncharacterized protein n=1 Tax=Branchiostoma floridae TaxID=7739 RepID=C3Z6Y2_BRAFL|eukprot:XP_002595566.1 hypothetical protein BRAFLDRAFT_64644 [Branchiostoma floridae]